MPPLLIATTNAGKVREIRRLLTHEAALLTLQDLPPIEEPEETGATFAENAVLKARYYARSSGLITIAEDSGLVIDALQGAPGVHSARYPGATYPDKFRNLYAALGSTPRPWTARYVCAVAVAAVRDSHSEPGILYEGEGTVEGEICPEPRGPHGFGYDPIFYFPPYQRTFGEVEDEEKLAVAHRGRAFRALAEWLASTRAAPLR
ncbi:MAG: RdgB/HAM1 family non-canonical purine NTP pyrophosphatase [Acidobacteria bacterium]|jgi:XTP/dITP diphosphohydrolase|nr:RdgB/HAM1 family non-canonical purine NTP pyrophosphatase [Acidobacteriota bacterium]